MIKSIARSLSNVVLTGALIFNPLAAAATTLRLVSGAPGFQDARIKEYYRLLGMIGDHINISAGSHTFQIGLAEPYDNYQISLTVLLEGEKLKIVEFSQPKLEFCTPGFIVDFSPWQGPRLLRLGEGKTGYVMELPRLVGRSTSMQSGHCAYLLAYCERNFFTLVIDSSPRGAEIWIGGELLAEKTKATLSVPFCDYEENKNVLLRMEARVNCQVDVPVSAMGNEEVFCDLPEPAN